MNNPSPLEALSSLVDPWILVAVLVAVVGVLVLTDKRFW